MLLPGPPQGGLLCSNNLLFQPRRDIGVCGKQSPAREELLLIYRQGTSPSQHFARVGVALWGHFATTRSQPRDRADTLEEELRIVGALFLSPLSPSAAAHSTDAQSQESHPQKGVKDNEWCFRAAGSVHRSNGPVLEASAWG